MSDFFQELVQHQSRFRTFMQENHPEVPREMIDFLHLLQIELVLRGQLLTIEDMWALQNLLLASWCEGEIGLLREAGTVQ
jgi:hypothetical protein